MAKSAALRKPSEHQRWFWTSSVLATDDSFHSPLQFKRGTRWKMWLLYAIAMVGQSSIEWNNAASYLAVWWSKITDTSWRPSLKCHVTWCNMLAGAMMSSWRRSGKATWNSMSIRRGSWLLWNTMDIHDVCMIGVPMDLDWIYGILWKCAKLMSKTQQDWRLKWCVHVRTTHFPKQVDRNSGKNARRMQFQGGHCHICFEGGATTLAKKLSPICSYLRLTSRWGWVYSSEVSTKTMPLMLSNLPRCWEPNGKVWSPPARCRIWWDG